MNYRLKLFSRFFLTLFILTSLLAIYLLFFSASNVTAPLIPPQVTLFVTISGVVISLLGFLITTALSFRRDRREARESELTLKQKEIELERARLELEQLKKQVNKKKK